MTLSEIEAKFEEVNDIKEAAMLARSLKEEGADAAEVNTVFAKRRKIIVLKCQEVTGLQKHIIPSVSNSIRYSMLGPITFQSVNKNTIVFTGNGVALP